MYHLSPTCEFDGKEPIANLFAVFVGDVTAQECDNLSFGLKVLECEMREKY